MASLHGDGQVHAVYEDLSLLRSIHRISRGHGRRLVLPVKIGCSRLDIDWPVLNIFHVSTKQRFSERRLDSCPTLNLA